MNHNIYLKINKSFILNLIKVSLCCIYHLKIPMYSTIRSTHCKERVSYVSEVLLSWCLYLRMFSLAYLFYDKIFIPNDLAIDT